MLSTGPTTTLYTDPEHGAYQRVVQQPFGGSIQLPAPFDVGLDTGQFPDPRSAVGEH